MAGLCRAAGAAAAALAAALFFTVGGAAAATPATVSGAGTVTNGPNLITFSVDASGVGPNATGTMRYDLNNGANDEVISGHVVCLSAGATTAMAIAQIDSSPAPSEDVGAVGHYMTFFLGKDGTAATFGSDFAYTPLTCWNWPAFESWPLQTGDITIANGDLTPPAITPVVTGTLGQNGWYTGDVHVSWDVSEPDSYLGFTFGCGDADVTADVYGQPFTCEAGSGGGRGTGSLVIRRDSTPPTITSSRMPANPAGWYDTPLTVSFRCSDLLSGVATCPAPASFDQEGTNETQTATAADNAGNTAEHTVTGINIDLTPPALTGAATSSPDAAGWYRNDVAIHWTCSDALSGVASCPANSTIGGEGAGLRASAFVRDVAGNLTNSTSAPVNIDRTPPLTTASAPVGWSKTAVTVALKALDNLSGVDATYASVDGGPAQATDSVSISGDGSHTLAYWSVDKAGNVEPERTIEVQIDTAAPTITHTLEPVPNAAGWNSNDVTVTFDCSDSISGIASCSAPEIVTGEGASLRVTGTAKNNAGWSTDDTALVSIDRTPTTIAATADRAPNANGWYSDDVVVDFACKDALSGVSSCAAPVKLAEGAGQSASGSATDIAGNSATASLGGVNVDKTAPAVAYSGNAGTYSIADTVNITCAASDALSGVASTTCTDITGPAWQFGLGVTSRSASATDLAGNTGTGSVTFTVEVTASSLETLIDRLVGDQSIAGALVAKVDAVVSAPNANAKAGKVAAFDNQVDAQTGKTISADDAALLEQLVAAL